MLEFSHFCRRDSIFFTKSHILNLKFCPWRYRDRSFYLSIYNTLLLFVQRANVKISHKLKQNYWFSTSCTSGVFSAMQSSIWSRISGHQALVSVERSVSVEASPFRPLQSLQRKVWNKKTRIWIVFKKIS